MAYRLTAQDYSDLIDLLDFAQSELLAIAQAEAHKGFNRGLVDRLCTYASQAADLRDKLKGVHRGR